MFNKSVLFIGVFLMILLFSAGTVMSQQPCQPEQCTVTAKRDIFDIAIMPLSVDGPFPSEVTGSDYCGSNEDECLLWRYQCIGDDCNNIGKVWVQIPICCDNPIEILWTSDGDPTDIINMCDADNNPGFTCDSKGLRVTPVAGGEGVLIWFSTRKDVKYNLIDMIAQVGSEYITCKSAIAGPGCSEPVPDVRVEPVTQCYQFIAENQVGCTNPAKSTWLAKWYESNPCAIEVFAAYGDDWDCGNVEHSSNKLTPESSEDIKLQVAPDVYRTLLEYRVNNAQCNTGWYQFVDEAGCNVRCYTVNSVRFCR